MLLFHLLKEESKNKEMRHPWDREVRQKNIETVTHLSCRYKQKKSDETIHLTHHLQGQAFDNKMAEDLKYVNLGQSREKCPYVMPILPCSS